MSGLSIPTSALNSFADALYQYERATKKDCVEILNRAALNIAYRAAQFTPVAEAADVRSQLFRDSHLVAALTSLSLKKRGIGRLPSPEFEREMKKFVTRRVGSRRYLRSGWAPAIVALGGSFKGSRLVKGIDGYGDRATAVSLLAEIAAIIDEPTDGKVEGAETIGEKALNEAVEFVTEDLLSYAQERLARTAQDHSG